MEDYRVKRETSGEGFVPLKQYEEMLYNVENANSNFNPNVMVKFNSYHLIFFSFSLNSILKLCFLHLKSELSSSEVSLLMP